MGPRRELTRADPAPPVLGASRSRVLDALRGADAPQDVVAVADQVDLHPNTTRFHLDALVDAGYAERATESRAQPGRPRMLYSSAAGSNASGRRSYRLLAEILAGYVTAESAQPTAAARNAGMVWGRYLTDRPPPFQQFDAAASTQVLVRTLDDIGFAPETVAADGQHQVLLHHCPFREVAVDHQEVVCSVHLGLMQGVLAELGAPIAAKRLEPFVGPSLCVAHLGAAEAG